ncbi:macro domain-containing protein [Kitasatospora sp. NPDC036755]|uniref:macro domain-containing protein n=1 Tax=Kitasatospora sp. NPDC036755 TaxID=3154600 RepID=UPI0033EAF7FD
MAELRQVRRAGVVRLRDLELPALGRIAARVGTTGGRSSRAAAIEAVLRLALSRIEAGTLQEAAGFSLGLARGTRDWAAADRRRRAADVYRVSVERFRKYHEVVLLGQLSQQLAELAARSPESGAGTGTGTEAGTGDGAAGAGAGGAAGRPPHQLPATHRTVLADAGGRTVPLTLHVHPVDLLRDVDVVVSPANTFLALPATYKSSVAAALRRAGASRGPGGDVVEDLVHDELRAWTARHGVTGRAVAPGTVAPTGAGRLAEQGVRRIYHAVTAVPRSDSNDYDVLLADITRAAARVFATMAGERTAFDPPLRSVAFPLLGSGRGGLRYEASLGALWAAVEAEAARGADWEVHLVMRRPAAADVVERLLGAA